MTPKFILPAIAKDRGPLYWLRPANWWAGRRKLLRTDHSNEWRYEFLRDRVSAPVPPGYPSDPLARSRAFSWLTEKPGGAFSFIVLGDTGEGDASQYALLPLIRALKPDFMIINGDVAYPAGNVNDYLVGFFQPYRGLGIPIWAVPGNHEYYSEGHGGEFFDVFCSSVAAAQWEAHGLILKPQPGSYWELSEAGLPLVVLGLDSGQSGALDGNNGFLGIGKRKADGAQHDWLEWRLSRAEAQGASVVVLFHIPKFVDGKVNGIGLKGLHAILARHPCVKLVVTAHIHNMQYYEPPVVAQMLTEMTGTSSLARPGYFISGGGGAYIGSTHFDGSYKPAQRYPTPEHFDDLAQAGQRLIGMLGIQKTLGGDVIGALGGLFAGMAERSDADQMRMLSLLHFDCRPGQRAVVTPYYFDDLATLYPEWPDGTVVRVQEGAPPLSASALAGCRVAPTIQL